MNPRGQIQIKTPEEIQILREGGRILAVIIQELKRSLKSGVTTREIDRRAGELIEEYHVASAFKGYRGFPGSICISVNQEVVHGIPSERTLKESDIVSLDAGIVYKGYYTDTAVSVGIGSIRPELRRLLDVTSAALYKGIEQAQVDRRLSDISCAIQQFVESHGFSVVRDFVGHGIGRDLHEDPEIPNFGMPGRGPVLKEGMVFAIEPMVNLGGWKTRILADGWTVVTQDAKPSAHFEHTVVICKSGPEILTRI